VTAEDTVALAEARIRVEAGELAEIRQRARLSQEAIGRAVGVTRVTVCKWEAGTRLPSGEPAVRLARLLRELEVVAAKRTFQGATGSKKEVMKPTRARR
jgi:DNA-binding transcriptional regulator YiaG